MIGTIRKFFDSHIQIEASSRDTASSEHALRLATAALLVEMTRADFHVAAEEREAVDRALREHFNLSVDETRELIKLAEQEARHASSLYPFTRLIDKHFTPRQKKQVVEMLWRVAFADGFKDKHEEYLVRKIADLLHVSHKDFIRARHKIEAEMAAT